MPPSVRGRGRAPRIAASALLPFAILFAPSGGNAAVHYVSASATGAGTGSSWEDAFTDLEDALGAAASGDAIWAAEGTYTPGAPGDVGASFSLESGVALYGGFAGLPSDTSLAESDPLLHPTVLSGDLGFDDFYQSPTEWDIHTPNSVHVLDASGVDSTALLDGFTILAGYASSASGGGLFAVGGSPTIRRCTFRRNLASFAGGGGAIYVQDGAPRLERCSFVLNYVHMGQGGAILSAGSGKITLVECTFSDNQVVGCSSEAAGGAVALKSTLRSLLTRCAFDRNTARNFYPAGCSMSTWGGAIFNFSGPMTLESCTFDSNRAHAGGAVSNWADEVIFVDCLFTRNDSPAYDVGAGSVGGFGAGIADLSFQPFVTTLVNCSIVGNTAGEASGVASYWSHETVLKNCVLWGNSASGEEVSLLGAQIKGNYAASTSCIAGLLQPIPGEDPPDSTNYPGCIDQDPLLASLAPPDARLTAGSPCIDAGDNFAVPAGTVADADGNARFVDDPTVVDGGIGTPPIVDMGCYEFGGGTITPVEGTDGEEGGRSLPFGGTRILAYPNPTRGPVEARWRLRSGAEDGRARFEVFDIAGRLRFQETISGASAEGSFSWDGEGADGRSVGPGVYFVRVRNAGDSAVRRIEVVR